jgi:hypothetical protein
MVGATNFWRNDTMKHLRNVRDCIEGIAGLEPNPTYAGGKKGGSELAYRLRDILENMNLEGLTGEQLDHLGRVLAGGLAAVKDERINRHYHVRDWGRRGPGMDRDHIYHERWMDHLSRLVSKENGCVYYRSEPYELHVDELRELIALTEAGWKVKIDASLSTHFPGRTTAVLVYKDPPCKLSNGDHCKMPSAKERRQMVRERECFVCGKTIEERQGVHCTELGILVHQVDCYSQVDINLKDRCKTARGRFRPKKDVLADLYNLRSARDASATQNPRCNHNQQENGDR